MSDRLSRYMKMDATELEAEIQRLGTERDRLLDEQAALHPIYERKLAERQADEAYERARAAAEDAGGSLEEQPLAAEARADELTEESQEKARRQHADEN